MDKLRLGKEIKKWRKHRNLTQINLADGICHQSEISRIEKGEVFPSIDILHLIASKLKIPVSYFYEVLIFDDVDYKNLFYEKILKLSKSKKYQEIRTIVENELLKKNEHPEFTQFLKWQYWTSIYNLKKTDMVTCLLELNQLIKKSTLGTDSYIELQIKNSIANIYAENNQTDQSIILYEEILKYEVSKEGFIDLKIKVLYNYGKSLYLQKKYDLSLLQNEEGIQQCIDKRNMNLIGHLLFQKAECLEKLNYSFHEISMVYQQAYFFFELLNLEYYQNIMYTKKSIYLEK